MIYYLSIYRQWESSKEPPSVIIIGCALESIIASNGSAIMLDQYKINITRLVQPIDQLHLRKTKVIWALQEPVSYEKLKPELQMVTNEQVDLYNKAALEVSLIYSFMT